MNDEIRTQCEQEADKLIEKYDWNYDEKNNLKVLLVETLEHLYRRIDSLLKERCYICRPETEGVSEEGCSDCDERSDMNHLLTELLSEISVLQDKNQELEKRVNYYTAYHVSEELENGGKPLTYELARKLESRLVKAIDLLNVFIATCECGNYIDSNDKDKAKELIEEIEAK